MWGIWLVNVAQLHTLLGGCYMSLCYNDNMRLILLLFVCLFCLKIIRTRFLVTFSYFEEQAIDSTGNNTADNWANPVHPLVGPVTHHNGWSEGTGRVHAGTGVPDRTQMSGSDGQSDGQRGRSLDVGTTIVTDAMNDEHEDEGDEGLDQDALAGAHAGVNAGDAQPSDDVGWGGRLNQGSSGDRSHALRHDIEGALQYADVGRYHQTDGDRRVDVAAAHVAKSLGQRGHYQAEGEGDLCHRRFFVAPAHRATDADRHQEEGSEEFRDQHAPYVAVLGDVRYADYLLHTCTLSHLDGDG